MSNRNSRGLILGLFGLGAILFSPVVSARASVGNPEGDAKSAMSALYHGKTICALPKGTQLILKNSILLSPNYRMATIRGARGQLSIEYSTLEKIVLDGGTSLELSGGCVHRGPYAGAVVKNHPAISAVFFIDDQSSEGEQNIGADENPLDRSFSESIKISLPK